MARTRRPPLVAAIGRLLIEYPAKDWRALARCLRDQALVNEIAAAIDDSIAEVAKARQKRKKRRPMSRVSVLARLAQEDEAKAEVLSALKLKLTKDKQAVTLADIRRFASSLGMKEELPRRRTQAVNQIISYLASRKTEEIQAVLPADFSLKQTAGREYERWADLILGKEANREGHNHSEADD